MPIYEYRCDDCGFQFDRLLRLSDPNPSCPRENPPEKIKSIGLGDEVVDEVPTASCGGETTKLISQSSFSLKGGGWYKDGY